MLLVRLVYFEARALYLADEPIIERLGDSADMPDQANDIRSRQMREIGCAKTRSRVVRLLPAQHRYSARPLLRGCAGAGDRVQFPSRAVNARARGPEAAIYSGMGSFTLIRPKSIRPGANLFNDAKALVPNRMRVVFIAHAAMATKQSALSIWVSYTNRP